MIRAFTVHICDDCLNLRGEMCHEPDCRFCRRTMAEVAEYLDVLLIRPVIDGVSVVVDDGTPLSTPVAPPAGDSPTTHVATCETNGHIYGHTGACVFCGTAKPGSIPGDAPPSCQWREIDSAPKDQSTVLLWWRDEREVEWWACGRWFQFGDGSRGWIGESFHSSEEKSWTRLLGEQPTHWQPLPAPPVVLVPAEENPK